MTVLAGKIAKQPWMIAPETVKMMEILHADGGDARFVGGCVRNALINRRVLDIDIATPLTPDEVIDRCTRARIHHLPTGLKHGTVTAVIDGKSFEVTTMRKDIYGYGRHADILFTDDWQTDASRRDFTFNALYATMDGDVHDYFGGLRDLHLGRVVFIGDPERRIREDVLRILRFFRFLAHYGRGEVHEGSLSACVKLAKLLPQLSAERVCQETFRLLESDHAADVWALMREKGVVTYFLPETTNTAALGALIELEDEYEAQGYTLRRLAALLDITPAGIGNVAQSLKLARAQTTQLQKMFDLAPQVNMHITPADVHRLVYTAGNDMARSLLLLAAAKQGEDGELHPLYIAATAFRAPRFPLTGEDVMKLGHPAGPQVGIILAEIENWWMALDFQPGRTECLEKLESEY